jgi:hypothetical protein
MTDQTKESLINKLSIQHGLLIGGVSIVLFVVFYLINPMLQFTNFAVPILSFAVVITLLVVMGIDVRKKAGGFWSFGEAYKSLIIMSVFFILLSTLCSFVVFKFVNPDLPEKVNSVMLDKMTETFSKMGMEGPKLDEAVKPFQNGEFIAKMQPTFKNELTNFGIALLIYAIINLIIAAIIKKNSPAFVQVDEVPAP